MINYEEIGQRIGKLVAEKQKAYGNSYGNSGKILEILFPNGVKPAEYTELLAICRVVDKLFRLANDPHYGGESPWGDIVGYGLLRLGSWEQRQKEDVPQSIDVFDTPKYRLDEGNIHDAFTSNLLWASGHDLQTTQDAECLGMPYYKDPVETCRASHGDPALRDSGLG
jgi:hypothetical protein